MMKVDKKSRLIGRIFSVAFGIALAKTLYDGGFHYHAIGHEHTVTAASAPIKYYFSLLWYGLVFAVATYVGFIAKLK
ncbi:hypothetical protein [Corallincola spongiicola]|uniref:Uncharacterized protein n=1 Tax=Corallincola spongiicola TaxID=2520508 RepID=A0ABY1WRC1_9GAMM|nr:hypothetical protein [Corallincola spongiicola]TAA47271.1 hypothetical protein EXY25_08530 [Corallincola spongiicola]